MPRLLLVLASLAPARADGVAEFFRGRNVDVYVGYSTGGGYDICARVLARHLGRHIPGAPTVVPQNMPGAGSLKLAAEIAALLALFASMTRRRKA